MAIQDADPALVTKWKNLGKRHLPCQLVFVLKPLTQTQQTADDADEVWQLCCMGRALNDNNESRCSTLAI